MTGAVHTGSRVHVLSAAVRIVGAALLVATGAIHLHLYNDGYRTIPTIGPMFLANVTVAFAAATALLVVPRRWLPWVAVAAGGFEVGSLAALFLSLTVGLFGFVETTQAPFVGTTILVEAAGAVVLLAFGTPPVLRTAVSLWRARRAGTPRGA